MINCDCNETELTSYSSLLTKLWYSQKSVVVFSVPCDPYLINENIKKLQIIIIVTYKSDSLQTYHFYFFYTKKKVGMTHQNEECQTCPLPEDKDSNCFLKFWFWGASLFAILIILGDQIFSHAPACKCSFSQILSISKKNFRIRKTCTIL